MKLDLYPASPGAKINLTKICVWQIYWQVASIETTQTFTIFPNSYSHSLSLCAFSLQNILLFLPPPVFCSFYNTLIFLHSPLLSMLSRIRSGFKISIPRGNSCYRAPVSDKLIVVTRCGCAMPANVGQPSHNFALEISCLCTCFYCYSSLAPSILRPLAT